MRKRDASQDEAAAARISTDAARARIRDLDGGEHELRELWAERPALIVFVHHFG